MTARTTSRTTLLALALRLRLRLLTALPLLLPLTHQPRASDAADIESTYGVLAYTTSLSCPSGWASLSDADPYRGRTIKASFTSPQSTYLAALTTNAMAAHSHATYSLTAEFTSKGCLCLDWDTSYDTAAQVDADFSISASNSAPEGSTGNVPYVTVQLCQYASGSALYAPPGLVAYVAGTSCPAGWSNFTAAQGRLLVVASPTVSAPVTAPTPAAGDAANLGSHAHAIPSQVQTGLASNQCCTLAANGCGACNAAYQSSVTWSASAPTSSSSLNVPYVNLMACEAATPTPGPTVLPDPSLFFFYAGGACPSLFVDAATQYSQSYIIGRVLWNLYGANAQNQVLGGAQLFYATQPNAPAGENMDADHVHTIEVSAFSFTSGSWDAEIDNGGSDEFVSPGPYTFSLAVGSANASLPYMAMRACSAQPPTSSPTLYPTPYPTTHKPSSGPTTSYPTRTPSSAPASSRPSAKPSHSPSRSPTTSKPSLSPTTGSPSHSPTTSKPSLSPTFSPSFAPTPAPVWVGVCDGADQTLFSDYDTYVIQMGACTSICEYEFIKSTAAGRTCALSKCPSISQYSTQCKHCIVSEMACQTANCSVSCAAYLYSESCATCTNTECRTQFSVCSGLAGSQTSAGGGDGGADAPPPATTVNYGLIGGAVGGALGVGFLGMAAGIFALRKYRERNVTTEMANTYERKIFGRNVAVDDDADAAAAAAAAAVGVGALGASLASGKDEQVASENPGYQHSSGAGQQLVQSAATGKAVAGKRLRTRYSFHGTERDEVDVPAGASLTAVDRNDHWTVVRVDETGAVGLIPNAYVLDA